MPHLCFSHPRCSTSLHLAHAPARSLIRPPAQSAPEQAPDVAQAGAEADAAHAHAAAVALRALGELVCVLGALPVEAEGETHTRSHAHALCQYDSACHSTGRAARAFSGIAHGGMTVQRPKSVAAAQQPGKAASWACSAAFAPYLLRARHLPVPPHMSQAVAPVPAHSRHTLASISAACALPLVLEPAAAAAAAAPVNTSS